MSMSKKDFIALADAIKESNRFGEVGGYKENIFTPTHLRALASFCEGQNPRFMRDRWLGYIAGTNGKNGGGVKEPKSWAVQGNYGQGWETVCTEDDRKEARVRLHEYDENEPEYDHRLVRA